MHERSPSAGTLTLLLYLYAALLVSALSYSVYISPLNLNDFLKHLFMFEAQGISKTFDGAFIHPPNSSEWRPLQLLSAHVIYKFFAQGHEHLVFKGMLVAFLFLTLGLFVRLLDVRSWTDLLAAVIALLVLLGHQSFGGAVEGVYPYGVEIVLLACQFAVLGILLRQEPSIASEAVAIAISVFAIALNEKGGLVGVSYIVGSVLRLPGGSLRSAVTLFVLYLAIVCYRFVWVSFPTALLSRSDARGPEEALFDAAAPILNILISDPRVGEFQTIAQLLRGKRWAIIYLTSSLALSALIVAWARSAWKRWHESDRRELKVAAILPFLLLGSAAFGPFSRKDYVPIMALAGYAVVSFYALRWLFAESLRAVRPAHYRALVALAVVLSLFWSIRAAGLVVYMRKLAYDYQHEWAFDVNRLGNVEQFDTSITQPIIARLRPEALAVPLNRAHFVLPKPILRLLEGRDCPEVCRRD
jgi:hypothetical protein